MQAMKRRRWVCLSSIVMAINCIALITLGGCRSKTNEQTNGSGEKPMNEGAGISIDLSIEDEVLLVSPVVKEFVESDIDVHSNAMYAGFAEGNLDYAVPLNVFYDVKGLPENLSIEQAILYISEDEQFSAPKEYTYDQRQSVLSVKFLKTNTVYYYKLQVTISDGSAYVKKGSFHTANTPRLLSIDGIVNVRDIGGWVTKQGKYIKQEMVYRGSELDGVVAPDYKLSAKGTQDMLHVLKIKTDMDLRSGNDSNGMHALGVDVKHIHYNAPCYGQLFEDQYKKSVRDIFADLADNKNYPVYLHCTYGNDRTGTICYLLEALLGVSDEDLLKEYELSLTYYGKRLSLESINGLASQIQQYSGETTQKKVENYLLGVGVTADELQSIRDILLSD